MVTELETAFALRALAVTHPLDDLRALAEEVAMLPPEAVSTYQTELAYIRSHYEGLIETFEEAIRLIDKVRSRLNKRKGELSYGRGNSGIRR